MATKKDSSKFDDFLPGISEEQLKRVIAKKKPANGKPKQ